MAQLARTFSPDDSAEQRRGGGGNVPNGIYELEIESSKPNENNVEGRLFRLDVVYNVRAPAEYEGRKIFDKFFLVHVEKPKGEKYGNDQFTFLCNAIGHRGPVDDSEDLHLRPFFAEVGLGKPFAGNDGTMKQYNEIKYFFDPNKDDEPTVGVFDEQPAPVSQPANDNRQPTPAAAKPAAAAAPKPAGARPWGGKK